LARPLSLTRIDVPGVAELRAVESKWVFHVFANLSWPDAMRVAAQGRAASCSPIWPLMSRDKSGAQIGPAGPISSAERVRSVEVMADNDQNQNQNQTSTDLEAPGGNPDNQATIENMDAPELRNAVVQLLTIIDDSDDLDVVITVADDGTVTVAAA
jgi:hypothetical protein